MDMILAYSFALGVLLLIGGAALQGYILNRNLDRENGTQGRE